MSMYFFICVTHVFSPNAAGTILVEDSLPIIEERNTLLRMNFAFESTYSKIEQINILMSNDRVVKIVLYLHYLCPLFVVALNLIVPIRVETDATELKNEDQ